MKKRAKKLNVEIKQVNIPTNEKNIVEALECVVEELKESEQNV